mmetsp:Transcript_10740/g.33080  ORF Transcript_10740/g.33080 Transcript_10740/m.33080 type:complete len:290 (-) Transcript_10740:151-1020(-)
MALFYAPSLRRLRALSINSPSPRPARSIVRVLIVTAVARFPRFGRLTGPLGEHDDRRDGALENVAGAVLVLQEDEDVAVAHLIAVEIDTREEVRRRRLWRTLLGAVAVRDVEHVGARLAVLSTCPERPGLHLALERRRDSAVCRERLVEQRGLEHLGPIEPEAMRQPLELRHALESKVARARGPVEDQVVRDHGHEGRTGMVARRLEAHRVFFALHADATAEHDLGRRPLREIVEQLDDGLSLQRAAIELVERVAFARACRRDLVADRRVCGRDRRHAGVRSNEAAHGD